MNRRTVVIVGAAFLLAAFLAGFIPQYLKRRDVERQLDTARQLVAAEQEAAQLDQIGLLIGNVYLQANLKNYGIAGQYATQFFDRLRSMDNQTQNPNLHSFAQAALAKRDAVIAGLAKGDPSTVDSIRDLVQRALQITQTAQPVQHLAH